MKLSIVCLSLFLLAAVHAEEEGAFENDRELMEELGEEFGEGRNLGRARGPRPLRKCKQTRKCKKLGGIPTLARICKRFKGWNWIQHDDFSNGEYHAGKCGCCYKGEDPQQLLKEDYFRLESVHMAASMQYEDIMSDRRRVSYEMTHDDSGAPAITNVQAMMDEGDDIWSFNSYAGKSYPVECSGGSCKAEIEGNANSPRTNELYPGEHARGDTASNNTESEEDQVWSGRLVRAVVAMHFSDFSSDKELDEFIRKRDLSADYDARGNLDAVLHTLPDKDLQEHGIKPVQLSLSLATLNKWKWVPIGPIDIFPPIIWYERKKNLCVQPVRIRHRNCAFQIFGICFYPTYTYSGAGLAFGRPGADSQWAKVDITFTWKGWKTIIDNAGKYKAVTTAEMNDLRNEIADDPCCIEVFFAPKFSPSSTYGGGACWNSGTANAQIITSDEQVSCGVDKTHLAHELGHALGLMHPGSGGNEGSTGTLMCPSGWQRDNPRRNSRDNGNNVVNPLLVSYFGPWTWFPQPECTSSADCGSCNAHIPPDSC